LGGDEVAQGLRGRFRGRGGCRWLRLQVADDDDTEAGTRIPSFIRLTVAAGVHTRMCVGHVPAPTACYAACGGRYVGTPFPHVAQHVAKTEGIGSLPAHRLRLPLTGD